MKTKAYQIILTVLAIVFLLGGYLWAEELAYYLEKSTSSPEAIRYYKTEKDTLLEYAPLEYAPDNELSNEVDDFNFEDDATDPGQPEGDPGGLGGYGNEGGNFLDDGVAGENHLEEPPGGDFNDPCGKEGMCEG